MSSWVYWPQILPQRWSVTTIPSLARPIFVRALLLRLTHHFFFRGRDPKMITIIVWHFEILCLNTGPIWQFFKWHFFRVLNFWAWSRRHLHYIIYIYYSPPSLCLEKSPKFLLWFWGGSPLKPSFSWASSSLSELDRPILSSPGLAVLEPNGDNQLPLHYPQPQGAAAPSNIIAA